MHNIYLMIADFENTIQWKIGVSKNPKKRFNEHLVSNPNLKSIVAVYPTSKEFAYKIESTLKNIFKHKIINGEWLVYDAIDKDTFLNLCDKLNTNFLTLKKNSTF